MAAPDTLVHRLAGWAQQRPDAPALHDDVAGAKVTWTWKRYWQEARDVGKGFVALGSRPGDRIGIVGDNRVEWVLAELGMMAAGLVPTPIYATNTVEQAAYVLGHAEATIVVCDRREQLDKLLEADRRGLATITTFVTMDDLDHPDPRVMSLRRLMERGRSVADRTLDERIDELRSDVMAMLVYTSGTTGTPKGVILDHGGMLTMSAGMIDRYPFIHHGIPYVTISYLPLCHVAEQMATVIGHLAVGGEVHFCREITRVREHLTAVRPTVFLGVPRVWEKMEAAIRARLAQATGAKARLARWAMHTELAAFRREVDTGRPVRTPSRRLARLLVIDKVKAALGLDRVALAATGAAPTSVSTLEFFASLGVTIYEGYGMTETSGVATSTEVGRPKFGTVGTALLGVEVRTAEDGEIQFRGRAMTQGYYRRPDETTALFTEDGWLCTGDLGRIDEAGNVSITGRKKDIIITAAGKNVAPAEIESHLKRIRGVSQAVVIGDRRPYLTALLTLDPEALPELCRELGIAPPQGGEHARAELREYFRDRIERDCNAHLARYQTIKRFELLDRDFSVEGGELTPTMKVKRRVVDERFSRLIASMYGDLTRSAPEESPPGPATATNDRSWASRFRT